MPEFRHSRSISRDTTASKSPRSPSPPSQTYHPSLLPRSVPTPALVESVAGGAHYSGVRVDLDHVHKRRMSSISHENHTDINHDRQRIMNDLKELYSCRPTMDIFERSWNKLAVFEDPLCRCKGFDEYAAQWFAMPKFFSKSETLSFRVMSSTNSPNRLVYFQVQEYTTRIFNRKKTIESVVVVDLDGDEKIIRMIDQWGGKELPSWLGSGFLRLMNAKLTPWLIRVPKSSR